MSHCSQRRRFIKTLALTAPVLAFPGMLFAAPAEPRRLRFYHTHTGEKLDVVYHEKGDYLPDAMGELNFLLRDFRSGDVVDMDRDLLDLLCAAQERLGSTGTYEIISAYRSPKTNEMLRKRGGGVARGSLHLQAKAIDVRLTDASTRDLRQVGLDLAAGGVGYYPKSNFVHLDTGRVRRW
ncbi:MAG: DUF882 domain-containing protein [Gammaproteobacteria bacterium]|jgi:uncharacterized protein YcbK (DUF882 family)